MIKQITEYKKANICNIMREVKSPKPLQHAYLISSDSTVGGVTRVYFKSSLQKVAYL